MANVVFENFVTELSTGEYGLDVIGYSKDKNGNYQSLKIDINGKQYVIDEATATKLDALIAKEFATESTLDTKLSNLETKMDTLLNSQDTDNNLNVKQAGDVATETTLGDLLTNFNAEDFASEATLDTRLSSLETKMDTLLNSQDTDNNLSVKQSGSIVSINSDGTIADDDVTEYRGLSTDTKPTTDVPLYSYFIEVDTDSIYYFDGTGWVMG